MDLPKIVSVDDHVVEPPHVWQTWLPEKHRERGPRGRAQAVGAVPASPGREVHQHRVTRRRLG